MSFRIHIQTNTSQVWNAGSIISRNIENTTPTNGDILIFNDQVGLGTWNLSKTLSQTAYGQVGIINNVKTARLTSTLTNIFAPSDFVLIAAQNITLSPTTAEFLATRSGVYQVSVNMTIEPPPTGATPPIDYQGRIMQNTGTATISIQEVTCSSIQDNQRMSMLALANLSVGDTVGLYFSISSSSPNGPPQDIRVSVLEFVIIQIS